METEVAGIWEDYWASTRSASGTAFSTWEATCLATRVLSRIEEAFGVDMPLQALFESPTLEGFAAALGQKAVESMEGIEGLSEEELALLFQEES